MKPLLVTPATSGDGDDLRASFDQECGPAVLLSSPTWMRATIVEDQHGGARRSKEWSADGARAERSASVRPSLRVRFLGPLRVRRTEASVHGRCPSAQAPAAPACAAS